MSILEKIACNQCYQCLYYEDVETHKRPLENLPMKDKIKLVPVSSSRLWQSSRTCYRGLAKVTWWLGASSALLDTWKSEQRSYWKYSALCRSSRHTSYTFNHLAVCTSKDPKKDSMTAQTCSLQAPKFQGRANFPHSCDGWLSFVTCSKTQTVLIDVTQVDFGNVLAPLVLLFYSPAHLRGKRVGKPSEDSLGGNPHRQRGRRGHQQSHPTSLDCSRQLPVSPQISDNKWLVFVFFKTLNLGFFVGCFCFCFCFGNS